MKKLIMLLTLCMTLSLAACGGSSAAVSSASGAASPRESAKTVEITVFAAASMQESLNAVIEQYKAVAPQVTVVSTYDSSGTLLTQIKGGAACDLFISAAPK